jgi:hypothetical protein
VECHAFEHLITEHVGMPYIFKSILFKAEYHTFIQELYSSTVCNVECHIFEHLFTEYVGMPYICRYIIV